MRGGERYGTGSEAGSEFADAEKGPNRSPYADQPNRPVPCYTGPSNWRFPDRMRGNDMKVVDATGTMILPTGKQLAAAAELRSLLSSVN